MLTGYFLKNVPNFRLVLFDHFLGLLNSGHEPTLFKLVVDKGLEKLQRHLLWKAALIQL